MSFEEDRKLNLEALLKDVGEFGAYQKGICFLLCALISLSGSMSFSFTFTNAIPPTRCFVPSCDSPHNPKFADATSKGFDAFAYPKNDSCLVFRNTSNTCDASAFASKERQNCSRWVYDETVLGRNYIVDFDLVCSDEAKGPLLFSAFFVGQMVGILPIGALADRFGRKTVFIGSAFSLALIGTSQGLFAYNYPSLLIFSFLTGLFQSGFFQLGYILGIEIVGKSKRLLCGSAIQVCFVLGELYLSLMAWYFRDWRKIILSFSLPCLLSIFYTRFIPESPRWLLAKGKNSEIERLMLRIAKVNGTPVPNIENYYADQMTSSSDNDSKMEEGFFQFMQSRSLIFRMTLLSLGWFVVGMSYYGLSLNASTLAGSIYINFSLLSLVEIPGYLCSFILMRLSGRRLTMVGSLMISGASIIVSSLSGLSWLKTLLYLLSKMSITCAFATIYLYTSELLPTNLRTGCVSVTSLVGKVGSLVSPYIYLLSSLLGSKTTMIVLGISPFICGLLFLCLPETLGKGLPNSIREAEQIGAHEHYIDDRTSSTSEAEPLIQDENQLL